jgi:hypothetical protein
MTVGRDYLRPTIDLPDRQSSWRFARALASHGRDEVSKSTARKGEFRVALQADFTRPVLREEIFRFLFIPNQWFLLVVPPQ